MSSSSSSSASWRPPRASRASGRKPLVGVHSGPSELNNSSILATPQSHSSHASPPPQPLPSTPPPTSAGFVHPATPSPPSSVGEPATPTAETPPQCFSAGRPQASTGPQSLSPAAQMAAMSGTSREHGQLDHENGAEMSQHVPGATSSLNLLNFPDSALMSHTFPAFNARKVGHKTGPAAPAFPGEESDGQTAVASFGKSGRRSRHQPPLYSGISGIVSSTSSRAFGANSVLDSMDDEAKSPPPTPAPHRSPAKRRREFLYGSHSTPSSPFTSPEVGAPSSRTFVHGDRSTSAGSNLSDVHDASMSMNASRHGTSQIGSPGDSLLSADTTLQAQHSNTPSMCNTVSPVRSLTLALSAANVRQSDSPAAVEHPDESIQGHHSNIMEQSMMASSPQASAGTPLTMGQLLYDESADDFHSGIYGGDTPARQSRTIGTMQSPPSWVNALQQRREVESGVPTMVVSLLGSGDYGRVFKGWHLTDHREYCIKVLKRPFRNQSDARAALREVDALSMCQHCPHVLRYYNSWVEEDKLHLQTELCEGNLREITSHADGSHSIQEDMLLNVLAHVASALSALHSVGYAHLDLKPENVFYSYMPGTRELIFKLGDFGLAQPSSGVIDIQDGDRRYLAPELLKDDYNCLAKADVFALGALAYELASCKPLPEDSVEYTSFRSGNAPPLPETVVPAPLYHLIKSMLHPDPSQRPSAQAILSHELLSCALSPQHQAISKLQANSPNPHPSHAIMISEIKKQQLDSDVKLRRAMEQNAELERSVRNLMQVCAQHGIDTSTIDSSVCQTPRMGQASSQESPGYVS